MTYFNSFFKKSLSSSDTNKFFSVEIVTFGGESIFDEFEAYTEEEAQEIAFSMYEDVDYVMIQGCYVA